MMQYNKKLITLLNLNTYKVRELKVSLTTARMKNALQFNREHTREVTVTRLKTMIIIKLISELISQYNSEE